MSRGGVPLHARVRPGSRSEPAPGQPSPPDTCPVKHCWVNTPVDEGPPRPGLLLEWRRDDLGRWAGRVAYAAHLRPGLWACVEEWLAAEVLTPL